MIKQDLDNLMFNQSSLLDVAYNKNFTFIEGPQIVWATLLTLIQQGHAL